MTGASWTPETFDRLYARDDDPWNFRGSAYEHEKYAATLAALGGRRFASACEVGCSIGVFTARLAERCDALLAVDVAEAALATARRECASLPHVTFQRRQIPDEWPDLGQEDGSFDLMVFSEVLYFLDAGDVARAARRTVDSLRPGGTVLLVNWIGPTDSPTTGEQAAQLFSAAAPGLMPQLLQRGSRYRLDLLTRPS